MDWRRRGKDRFSSTDSILLMSRAFGAYFALVGNLAGKLLRPAADETHSFARDNELLRYREDISLENARKSKTDGMDPARYKRPRNGPRMCEQHPQREEGPRWKLQRSGSTWQRVCSRLAVQIGAGGW